MIAKKRSKFDFRKAFFGLFFAILSIFSFVNMRFVDNVYAEPVDDETEVIDVDAINEELEEERRAEEEAEKTAEQEEQEKIATDKCQDSWGALGCMPSFSRVVWLTW